MHIIAISGILCPEQPIMIWEPLYRAFKKHFPFARMSVEQEGGFLPWDIRRMNDFCDQIVARHDEGGKTLLVGHSMGGVFATAIANRFRHTPIFGVVTIFAPHLYWGGVYPWLLGEKERVRAPIVSFGASDDELVWWGTRHPQSISHTTLISTHYVSLVTAPELLEENATTTKKVLFA